MPNIEIAKANIEIEIICESACPSSLTEIKKLIAIAVPPSGVIFKLESLFCLILLLEIYQKV